MLARKKVVQWKCRFHRREFNGTPGQAKLRSKSRKRTKRRRRRRRRRGRRRRWWWWRRRWGRRLRIRGFCPLMTAGPSNVPSIRSRNSNSDPFKRVGKHSESWSTARERERDRQTDRQTTHSRIRQKPRWKERKSKEGGRGREKEREREREDEEEQGKVINKSDTKEYRGSLRRACEASRRCTFSIRVATPTATTTVSTRSDHRRSCHSPKASKKKTNKIPVRPWQITV